MAIYGSYANGTITTSGTTWTNTANANSGNNGTFATLTNVTKSSTNYIQVQCGSGVSFDSTATISSVTAQIWNYVGATGIWTTYTAALYTSTGTIIGSAVALTQSTTTTNNQTVTFATKPTVAQLNAGVYVRITAARGNTTTSATVNVDAVYLTVNYLAPPVLNAGSDATIALGDTWTGTGAQTGGNTLTSQSWTVAAGPANVGLVLSTTASASYSPTVGGTYTLRYSATNADGTGTDDLVLTVSAPTPIPFSTGFETDFGGFDYSGGTLQRTTGAFHTGSNSVYWYAQVAGPTPLVAKQTFGGLSVGVTYTVAIWVRTDAAAETASLGVTGMSSVSQAESTTWAQLIYQFVATSTKHEVYFSHSTVNAGGGYFDDFSIAAATATPTGDVKVGTGATFAAKPVKYWNNTAWVVKPVKYEKAGAYTATPY